MIKTGILFDTERLEKWLEAVNEIGGEWTLTGIACPGEVFEDAKKTAGLCGCGISCVNVTEIVSGDALRMFEIAEDKDCLTALLANIYRLMKQAFSRTSVSSFSLPIGLDGISEEEWPEKRDKFAEILVRLLSAPMPHDFTIELPVHFPRPFPTSTELERCMELCDAVNALPLEKWDESYGIQEVPPLMARATVGLAVHLRPDEGIMPDLFDKYDMLSQTKSVYFHYDVSAGETLFDDEQAQWARNLNALSYNGNVVFEPLSCPDVRMAEICRDASEWAKLYNPVVS